MSYSASIGNNTVDKPAGLLTRLRLFISVFVIIFLTRIFGFIDISFALLLVYFVANLPEKVVIPNTVWLIVAILFSFMLYSLFIALIYGVNEIIWVMKFARTCIMAFLLFYFFYSLKQYVSYERFQWICILIVALHSILIYFMVANESVRNAVYSVTGFVPRGPAWSRSPGVTISYNATAIVHMTAIFFLARMNGALLKRLLLLAIIFPSIIFLGRSMAYVGLLLIAFYMFWRFPVRTLMIGFVVISVIIFALEFDFEPHSTGQYYANNLKHALEPIMSFGSDKGVENYYSTVLAKHIYFSQDWKVLLFGNSYSGHMALIGPIKGETDSDLGIINSINGNGLLVTFGLYMFYFYLIYISRHGDWLSVSFITALCFVLTFKETGFFTSHATPLLLMVVYYQQVISRTRHEDDIQQSIENNVMRC